MLYSNLCNLYLNKIFLKGKKKKPNAQNCAQSHRKASILQPLGTAEQKAADPDQNTDTQFIPKAKNRPMPSHALISYSTLMNPTTSLFSVPLYKITCFNNAVTLTAQGCRVLYPVIMESDPEVQPPRRKKSTIAVNVGLNFYLILPLTNLVLIHVNRHWD